MSNKQLLVLSSSLSSLAYIPIIFGNQIIDHVTFTRASSGTYYDANGILRTASANQIRYHHLQDGSGRKGFLFEEGATNLILSSEAFKTDDEWSAGTNVTLSTNTIEAPDGEVTGATLTATSTSGTTYYRQSESVTSGEDWSGSIFVKKSNYRYVGFRCFNNYGPGNDHFVFDFDTEQIVFQPPTEYTKIEIEKLVNGWYRLKGSIEADSTATRFLSVCISDASGSESPTLSGGEEVYVWGAQGEKKPYVSSYIKTSTSSASRSGDIATIDTSSAAWYNANSGTLYAEYVLDTVITGTQQNVVSINATSNSNSINIAKSGASETVLSYVNEGGGGEAAFTFGLAKSGSTYRHALAYEDANFAGCVDAGDVSTELSGVVPNVTRIQIGDGVNGTHINGIISDLRLYPTRLPNASLQSLTQNDLYISLIESGVLNSKVRFSRASSGTYFDENGILQSASADEARINYLQDGSGEYGLLIEGSSTNLITYSSEIDLANGYSTNNATLTPNHALAPDGTTTAARLEVTETNGAVLKNFGSTGNTYAASCWVKSNTGEDQQCQIYSEDTGLISFTATNEWQRISASIGFSVGTNRFDLGSANSGADILFWGMQGEDKSFASSYIPTTSSTATRAADVTILPLSIAHWFNEVEGSIYSEWNRTAENTENGFVASIDDNSSANRLEIRLLNETSATGNVVSSSTDNQITKTITAGSTVKGTLAYKASDNAFTANGLSVGTDSTALGSGFVNFQIGRIVGGSVNLNGIIKELRYYTKRKSNTGSSA